MLNRIKRAELAKIIRKETFQICRYISIESEIKYIEKEIYFRNIYLFIKRTKNLTITKNTTLVRENL